MSGVEFPGDNVDHDAHMRDVMADVRQDRDEIKRLREQRNEAIQALDDLSFACCGGLWVKKPDVETYNRTFLVLDKLRTERDAEGRP